VQPFMPYWLVLIISTAVLTIILKNEWQRRAKLFLILVTSVFVSQFFFQMFTKDSKSSYHSMRTESITNKVEIPLKCDLACKIVYKNLSTKKISQNKNLDLSILAPSQAVFKDTHKILNTAIHKDNKSTNPKVELIILLGSTNQAKYQDDITKLIAELKNSKDEQISKLANCLAFIYSNEQNNFEENSCEIISTYPYMKGWFKDVSLLKFYHITKNHDKLNSHLIKLEEHYTKIAVRLALIFLTALMAGLIGIIVIIIYIATAKKGSDNAFNLNIEKKSVYIVFLAWFTTQITISWCWHLVAKSWKITNTDPLLAALLTCLTYILSNIPGILYIWYFAFRKNKLNFWQALRLKIPEKKYQITKIILFGVLGWCAALPLVFVSHLIASHYFGSSGSDNPVLILVIQAASSRQFLPILIIAFTIGILAPFCEEIMFRGFLYAVLRQRFSIVLSALISALCFSLAHFDKGGALPLLSIGFILALVYEKSKNLFPSIITHSLWNISSFTIALVIFGTS
jgi:membrane protease YdiL (CAAX protease family)